MVVVAVLAWTVTFRLIGGTFPRGPGVWTGQGITWGMRWRSLIASVVAVVLAAYALEFARTTLP